MPTAENFKQIKRQLPGTVRLVVVSKTRTPDEIMTIYSTGHRIFGENKAQELIQKQPLLPADIQWHFIGHLQTNKVKYIAPFVHLIESVDSLRLLMEIEKQAGKNNRRIHCLLQLYIATEETKFGLSLPEAEEILNSTEYKALHNICLSGVMGMASFTDDMVKVRQEFHTLSSYFHILKNNYFQDSSEFNEISMGMSGDWEIAVQEGTTMVRIGTAIFGEREY